MIILRAALGVALLGGFACLAYLALDPTHPPSIASIYPLAGEVGIPPKAPVTLTFATKMQPASINSSTLALRDTGAGVVPAAITYDSASRTATLSPSTALLPGTTYHVTLTGGPTGAKDNHGRPLAESRNWTFTTGVAPAASPNDGPGGPILLITSAQNGFSQYYAEILRNEGLNEFTVIDISRLDRATLQQYDIALLGEIPLTSSQAGMLTAWVRDGGDLIAMRPDRTLAKALGLAPANASDAQPLHDAYLAISADAKAGAGLVHEPLQFHGPADEYLAGQCAPLATLYRDAHTATPYPAVCTSHVGRGHAIIFTYDLARSVVYTRQGNPLWSGQERDGLTPIRAEDLFYGGKPSDPQPDWVDRDRIQIPQADEQQRLLANIITLTSAARMPLPHFWYLPRGLKAAIVMTGDDHGHGGTIGRFISYMRRSPPGCSLETWQCIRGTSNVFVGSISSFAASAFVRQGFEIGLHVYTGCQNWPAQTVREPGGQITPRVVRAAADDLYTRQLAAFAAHYPGVPPPVSNRIDCVTWGDYDTQPQVELAHGIRFDTNYYYWPPEWARDTPGLFTGSGLPMRFARLDGSIIDVYQATTQMTDESKQTYPATVDTLLANALGSREFYAVLTANMHTDNPQSPGSDAIIAAALSHHIPIVTAAQMLTWLDGRNASSFQNLNWKNGELSFTTSIGTGANGIQVLLPITCAAGNLVSLTLNGAEVKHESRTIAGLEYAAFDAAPGQFTATYRH